MNAIELKQEINKTLSDLCERTGLFDQELLNKVPFVGNWTAGQVIRHLILSNGGFADIMNGPVTKTARPYDQMIDGIKDSFLDFTVKMKSPDFIQPEFKQYQKDEQLKSLELIKNKVNKIIDEADLTVTCTSFKVPVLGELTRWECLHFILYHTQRHIYQLSDIFQKLNK